MVFYLWTELDWALIVMGYIPGDAELVELIVATTVWLEFILLAEKLTEIPEGTPLAENFVTSLKPKKTSYEISTSATSTIGCRWIVKAQL